ncbi:hypothetical protein DXG03_003257 [Asterophora parasitica]|uniref:Ribosomal L1 domain-containing protein 1 n=1 Tax=Asterophora parasitica TaxID=117018 RepID=A0A9P7GG34_9AGAR|nr:hypothetical protein DXG03_003257 [Asterophora parasitica]
MAKAAELIDERVSALQCKKAIEALHAYESKKEKQLQESELLPGKEPNIWLNVTVKKIPSGHKFKPAKIPIAHPLIDPRTTPICLITKDPQREYKDLLEKHKIKFISRVVGIEKLKGKFKPFEARRLLLKENGLFLADERVVPLLPKLLGSKWFDAKKQPIPVCLTRKDLKGELERAVSSTYMNQNRGTCTAVKIAILSQTPAQILANLKVALPAIAKHISGGWENVQALHIKTNSSVSLPIWSCNLDESEGGRWTGLTAKPEEEGSDAGSDEEGGEAIVVDEQKVAEGKGKKRTQEDDEVEKPNKKAKGTKGQTLKASTPVISPTEVSTAETNAPQKSKKKKSLASDTASATAAAITVEPSVTVESPITSRSKKSISAANEELASAPANATPKKKAATETEKLASTPVPAPSPAVTDAKSQKKKKARLSVSDPLPTPQPTEDPQLAKTDESPTKSKKGKKAEKAVEVPAYETIATSLSKDELKQKRSGAPGEKKKSKVNSIGGKSAKDRVLGKKAAQ